MTENPKLTPTKLNKEDMTGVGVVTIFRFQFVQVVAGLFYFGHRRTNITLDRRYTYKENAVKNVVAGFQTALGVPCIENFGGERVFRFNVNRPTAAENWPDNST